MKEVGEQAGVGQQSDMGNAHGQSKMLHVRHQVFGSVWLHQWVPTALLTVSFSPRTCNPCHTKVLAQIINRTPVRFDPHYYSPRKNRQDVSTLLF